MKPSTKKVLITGAAGVAMLAAGAVPAFAAPKGAGHPGGVSGTVSAVSGTTLTLAGTNGTSYRVDATGARVVKGVVDAKPAHIALADVKVGDSVAVMGPVVGTNITARVIFDGPVPARLHLKEHASLGAILVGSISSISGSTLSVTPLFRGATTTLPAVSVLTTASTTVVKDGQAATLANLSVGQHILVSGTKGNDGTITATKLLVRTEGAFGGFLGHGHEKWDGKGKGNNRGSDSDE